MLNIINIETNNPYVIAVSFCCSAIPVIKFIKNQRFKSLIRSFDSDEEDSFKEPCVIKESDIVSDLEKSCVSKNPVKTCDIYPLNTKRSKVTSNFIQHDYNEYQNRRSPSFHLNSLDEMLHVIENSFNKDGSLNLESNNWKFRKGKFTWGRKIYFRSPIENKKVVVSTQASPENIKRAYSLIVQNYNSIVSKPWKGVSVRSEDHVHIVFPFNDGKYYRIPGSFIYWV